MSHKNGRPDPRELAEMFDAPEERVVVSIVRETVKPQLAGFQDGPHVSVIIPLDPPPGDCKKCGFTTVRGCDDGTVKVDLMGYRHCPHLSVAELRRK